MFTLKCDLDLLLENCINRICDNCSEAYELDGYYDCDIGFDVKNRKCPKRDKVLELERIIEEFGNSIIEILED